MFIEREARKNAKGLSDPLDYFAFASHGVVTTSSGVHLAAWEFAGWDMDALPLEECSAIEHRLAKNLSLGAGWSLQCALIRDEYTEYAPVTSAWPEPVSLLVEEERRARFELTGTTHAPRLSRYYFCLSYESKSADAATRHLLGIHGEAPAKDTDVELDRFEKRARENRCRAAAKP